MTTKIPVTAGQDDDSSSEEDEPVWKRFASNDTATKMGDDSDSSDDNVPKRWPAGGGKLFDSSDEEMMEGGKREGRKRKRSSSKTKGTKRIKTEHKPRREPAPPPVLGSIQNPKKASEYATKEKIEKLASDTNATRWWDREPYKDDIKWTTLDHNGVLFPPPYEQHHIKPLYDGRPLDLTPAQEELATFYAVMLETEWVTKKVFNRNFFQAFRKSLIHPKAAIKHPDCTHFGKFNFSPILEWATHKKEVVKEMKKEKAYKDKLKKERDAVVELFGYAVVDGVREKVGNYKVEPPGLFRGRGEHPKMGQLKKRLVPEQVILNIGEGMPIPPCPVPGHNWGGVIHDRTVTYIAKWVENINGSHKMVYLHASSRFKGESDRAKFEKARELKKYINVIRADYNAKMIQTKNIADQQLATCIWVIDYLSIRVGNEKDTDEEADTVGVCSFRKEHLLNFEVTEDSKYKVMLRFLGKDSMLYENTVELPMNVYNNLKRYHEGCATDDAKMFDKVEPDDVNRYLKSFMPGLSAKCFRTHNASVCLHAELLKTKDFNLEDRVADILPFDTPEHEKVYFYNSCNKQVAILCNHKRTVNQESFSKTEEKMIEKIKRCEDQIKEMEHRLALAKGEVKPKEGEEKWTKKEPRQIEDQITKKKGQLQKFKLDQKLKHENKEVALGTSKINYMDPRITVAFAKRMELHIEKVFSRSLLDKFPWAMAVSPDFVF